MLLTVKLLPLFLLLLFFFRPFCRFDQLFSNLRLFEIIGKHENLQDINDVVEAMDERVVFESLSFLLGGF